MLSLVKLSQANSEKANTSSSNRHRTCDLPITSLDSVSLSICPHILFYSSLFYLVTLYCGLFCFFLFCCLSSTHFVMSCSDVFRSDQINEYVKPIVLYFLDVAYK